MTADVDHHPQMVRRQLERALEQVRSVRDRTAFFAARVGELPPRFDSVDDFAAEVPAVTKQELIDDQLLHPPFGGQLAVDATEVNRYYVYPAGQVLAWTANDQARLEDMYADGLRCTGLDARDVIDITFQFGWVVAGTIWDAAARRLGAAVMPGGAGESARHAHNLNLVRGTSIIGFSTFIERIAESAEEMGLDPAADLAVRHLLIVGEWHGSEAKEKLSQRYGGAVVREAYGTGETGLVAAECEVGDGIMHVHPDILVEVRHEVTGELVLDGSGGELYLTPLDAEAMPVLRFRTGDLTKSFTTAPCACGRTTPRIGEIVGRVSDLLRVKGSFLSQPLLQSVLADVHPSAGTFHMQVSRPEGMDVLEMTVEADDAPADFEAVLSRRIKERAGVLVTVRRAESTLDGGGTWYTDLRRE